MIRKTPLRRSSKPIKRSRIAPVSKRSVARPVISVYADGREVLNNNTNAGRAEYKRRAEAMRQRQGETCCICNQWLSQKESTFEHEASRGMGGGFRDDRIEINGKPINGAAHGHCNRIKGSKHIVSKFPTPEVVTPNELVEWAEKSFPSSDIARIVANYFDHQESQEVGNA